MSLVDRVKALATSRGISIAALERECGFGNGTLRKWSHQSPSVDKVVIVADKLNVSLEYLITGQEPPNRSLNEMEQQLISMYRELDQRDKQDLWETAQLKLNRELRAASSRDVKDGNITA